MKILGAILAGGESRRFGGDKGAALVDGRAVIDLVADALRPQCEALVIVGRNWPGLRTAPDLPGPGLGPLGGLCGALALAKSERFSQVLTAPCDTLPVPGDLVARLGEGGAFRDWPLIALWPASLAPILSTHLSESKDRSVMRWLRLCGLPEIEPPPGLVNINTPADLARLR